MKKKQRAEFQGHLKKSQVYLKHGSETTDNIDNIFKSEYKNIY